MLMGAQAKLALFWLPFCRSRFAFFFALILWRSRSRLAKDGLNLVFSQKLLFFVFFAAAEAKIFHAFIALMSENGLARPSKHVFYASTEKTDGFI